MWLDMYQMQVANKVVSVTFPGVVVGNDPSASFPGQSLSFCFPVLSCILLLKRRMVAPPINPSSFPHETSQTYM
jgi:hypothetical protein